MSSPQTFQVEGYTVQVLPPFGLEPCYKVLGPDGEEVARGMTWHSVERVLRMGLHRSHAVEGEPSASTADPQG
jgi:hypothetical protein